MPPHAINGTITSTVTLFGGTYVTPLTIGKLGVVKPVAAGATGIYLPSGHPGSTITNNGHVGGGDGGATGGIGVDMLSRSVVTNNGTITGGNGGYFANAAANGGVGVDLTAGGTITNAGLIAGGTAGGNYFANGAGGIGVATGASSQVTNHGTILGGHAYSGYGTGGIGVDLTAGGILVNTGTIAGGIGGAGTNAPGSGLGSGVYVAAGGVLTNSGDIAGGAGIQTFGSLGTTSGGEGVVFKAAGTLSNTGTITGGGDGNKGSGGAAVALLAGGRLTNSGTIVGGSVSGLSNGQPDSGGGVDQVGGVLTNTGTIAGNGAGIGVYMNGGTLIDAGTIMGGQTYGTLANAVAFGSLGGTLVIEPGAVFDGGITATNHANSYVQLAGTTAGTLIVNGPFDLFRSFTWVAVEKGSKWTLTGNPLIETLFTDVGTLDIPGTVGISRLGLGHEGTLLVGGAGTAHLGSINLAGGTFTDQALGVTTVGPTSTGGIAGDTVINAGGTISGYGTVNGTVVDNGSIVALGGRSGPLVLAGAVTGSGVATLNRNSTLQVNTSLAVKTVQFGPAGYETLMIGAGASMTAPISGFGTNDAIDVLGIKANGLTFLGGTLDLQENGTTVDQFVFKGTYTPENFRLVPDTQGGTDIHYVATAASASPDAASAPANADPAAGGAANFGPWTDNPSAVVFNNGGEGGHSF